MSFTDEQNAELAKPLNSANVKQREQGRTRLSYVESWHVIAEANRIFGFDGWDSHTVEVKCVAERERKIGKPPYEKDGWGVTYTARVIIRVGEVERSGTGAGHGIDADLGLAHESAIKEAESDARKRALMTFGNPFGLALYDKTQANVVDTPPEPLRKPVAAESNNPAPEQPSLYKRLSVANSACGDKAAFNALWGNPATIKAQSSLSVNESTWLEKEKAKKFAELEVNEPSDYVPPSFDDLPEPTQQAVKNLGA